MTFSALLIAFIWLIGACLRVYRYTRFYQIEEYMSGRFLRWLFGERTRWLPTRPLISWLTALVGLSEASSSLLPTILMALAALAAGWPPREREVKKPFRRTPRATRLLITAFVVTALILAAMLVQVVKIAAILESDELTLILSASAGFLTFILAPFALIVGNILMTPVEALFRQRFKQQARRVLAEIHPTVIGITGSYGKTSTKNYLADILSGRYRVLATPKSYNTIMGVSMTINNTLADDFSVEYFIAEMGAYVPGEIKEICDLTQPRIGIMVEVGLQHLERFGSLENVARAKYELIKALPPDGIGVFNWDNPYIREMFERGYPNTRLAVSRTVAPSDVKPNGPRFIASEISETLEGLRFTVTDTQSNESQPFATALLGEHTVTNLLLAIAVAVHEGMSLRDVARRVSALQPPENRLVRQVTANGITIINDAYSANPVGALGALRVLALHTTGRRLLITPGMVELGSLMESENRKLGEAAASAATDVILVGEKQGAPIKAGLLAAGFPAQRLQVVETLSEAVTWYQNELQSGDTVLFLNDLPDTY
ncbi:MAG: UDP-N-acetylmuramoyl-tripeptide--D-alanyl-D-alanine ligase [Burkholderiales bacterium]|nr:UDP-N-acetylmuramoyl-tripeptide--D-alanyl-D-alanine ligase [Anaerolineae bacterium]